MGKVIRGILTGVGAATTLVAVLVLITTLETNDYERPLAR